MLREADCCSACACVQVRLNNWNALTPVLARLGVLLSSDEKTLIVAGDTATLVGRLYELRTRMGLGSASIHRVAAQAIKQSATEDADAEAESNKWEIRRSTAFQLASVYAIVVACLLSIFVSQSCDKLVCSSTCGVNGTTVQTVRVGPAGRTRRGCV